MVVAASAAAAVAVVVAVVVVVSFGMNFCLQLVQLSCLQCGADKLHRCSI